LAYQYRQSDNSLRKERNAGLEIFHYVLSGYIGRNSGREIFDSCENIKISGGFYTDGDITVDSATFEGDAVIAAEGDIKINVDSFKSNVNVILYSEQGNISLSGSNLDFAGVMYAPRGNVTLSANVATVNGRIVCKNFVYEGSELYVLADDSDLFFIRETPEITATPTATTEVTPSTTVAEDIDYELDSDDDGLPDNYEDLIGTDKFNADTDGDGISDYYELMLELDPCNPDTDGNGIPDGDEDYDSDGLTNLEEINYGTNPAHKDSDFDGLSDYEEINVHGTDPLNWDSDEDGIGDGDELDLGLNPLSKDSDNNGTSDSDEKIYQTLNVSMNDAEPEGISDVTVSGYISGCIKYNTQIDNCYYEGCVASLIEGVIGVPVNIETTGAFDEMTIVMHYDETKLGDAEEGNLRIYWIDYDSGMLVPMTSEVNEQENTVSCKTNHFSQYVLVDEEAYAQMWSDAIDKAVTYRMQLLNKVNHYDIVIACQKDGTTTSTQRNLEYRAAYQLVHDLKSGDRATVFAYGGINYYDYANYVAYGDDFGSKIQTINRSVYKWDSGSQYLYGNKANLDYAFRGANTAFDKYFSDGTNKRQFILFTNGANMEVSEELLEAAYIYGYDVNIVMIGGEQVRRRICV